MKDYLAEVKFMIKRDGEELGIAYAKQCLSQYRQAARGHNHFAHCLPFRPHFVLTMLAIRKFLRGK